jgi:hypothetical protein
LNKEEKQSANDAEHYHRVGSGLLTKRLEMELFPLEREFTRSFEVRFTHLKTQALFFAKIRSYIKSGRESRQSMLLIFR